MFHSCNTSPQFFWVAYIHGMARPNKFNQGFAAGLNAAADFLRDRVKEAARRNQAKPHQVAEWLNMAAQLANADISPKQDDPVVEAVAEAIDHPERD